MKKNNELFEIENREDGIGQREAIAIYLEDEFFYDIKTYLEKEDYALAKDAIKGLFILANEFKLFDLYASLLEIYEDIEYSYYNEALIHYNDMFKIYEALKKEYLCTTVS